MTATAPELQALLATKLATENGLVAEVDYPAGEDSSQWVLFLRVRVTAAGDGYELRFVEGPGVIGAMRDPFDIAVSFAASVWQAHPELVGVPYDIIIDPDEEFPSEWIRVIEAEAKRLIGEVNAHAGLIGGTDPTTEGIVESVSATLTGNDTIEIAFWPGPGFDRVGDEDAASLFAMVPERVQQRLPQLAGWSFELVWGEA